MLTRLKIKSVYAFAMRPLPSTEADDMPVVVEPDYVAAYRKDAAVVTEFTKRHVAQGHSVGVFRLLESH